jgi:hypothetical protein
VERRINRLNSLSHVVHPADNFGYVAHPVLAQDQDVALLLSRGIPDPLNPFFGELPTVMRDGV